LAFAATALFVLRSATSAATCDRACLLEHAKQFNAMIEGGRCTGVECLDGSQYRGRKGVVSTIHPKNLIAMAPREPWGQPPSTRCSEEVQPRERLCPRCFVATIVNKS
jgi:hypothetical protein